MSTRGGRPHDLFARLARSIARAEGAAGVAEAVATGLTPTLADVCLVDRLDRDGVTRVPAGLGAPATPGSGPIGRVLAGGELQRGAGLGALGLDVRPGEPWPWIVVPVIVAGAPAASITLARAPAFGPFEPEDVVLAADVAELAGLALDRVARIASAEAARRVAERAAARLAELHGVVARLSTLGPGASIDSILETLADVARRLVDARLAAITFQDGTARRVVTSGSGGGHGTLAIPLRDRDGVLVGSLAVSDRVGRTFDAEDERALHDVGALIAASLAHALAGRAAADVPRRAEQLLSAAAHELRTPLAALSLQVESLLRGALASELPEGGRARARVEAMMAQVDRLNKLVDALLDVGRLERADLALHPEPTDLVEVTRDVLARLHDQLAWAGCETQLRAGAPVVGRWDRLRVEQAVTNLVSNAMKYGGGRPIEVAIEGDEASGRIVVQDHGIGIAREDHERIFERFERLAGAERQVGFGLGLWIVRQIADAHGGRVAVESEPGQGARFTLSLPRGSATSP